MAKRTHWQIARLRFGAVTILHVEERKCRAVAKKGKGEKNISYKDQKRTRSGTPRGEPLKKNYPIVRPVGMTTFGEGRR